MAQRHIEKWFTAYRMISVWELEILPTYVETIRKLCAFEPEQLQNIFIDD